MAVRKFILTIGQSNGGTKADYATWAQLHPNMYVDYPIALSTEDAEGAYTDTFTLPGTWPEFPTCSLKGTAVDSIRYLTFYNPCATGLAYLSYPGTARVTAFDPAQTTSSQTALTTSLKWQFDPTGRTITRERTGTTHTVSFWGGGILAAVADQILVTPAFDPPATAGEEITYPILIGTNSGTGNYICVEPRYGDDFGTDGSWNGSLAGLRVRCTSSTHPNNVGLVRYVSSITLDAGISNDVAGAPPTVKMTFSEALPHHPNAGDTFVIEPPPVGATDVPFSKYAYFLPWCPIEGRTVSANLLITAAASAGVGLTQLTAAHGDLITVGSFVNITGQAAYQGTWPVIAKTSTTFTIKASYVALSGTSYVRQLQKGNPFPPGFNYPNHISTPQVYQPFVGESYLYGAGSPFALSPRAAYHTGLANRLQEQQGEIIYVVNLAVDGVTLAQQDLYVPAMTPVQAVGWFDPAQQTSWSAGDRNNLFQRLVDTLDAAKLAAQRDGDTLDCLGVFFVQGEGDTSFVDSAERYYRNLTTFKRQVRAAIKSANLYSGTESTIPWVQPLVTSTPWTFSATVNQAIQLCVSEDRYMRTVAMDDATKIVGDSAHYDAAGITLLEYRAFTLWRNISESLDVAGVESALVVEDGTGLATSNSYATTAFCDTYFANQGGLAAWTNANVQVRTRALVQATMWLDANYGTRFAGYRGSNTQALEFPRSLAYDAQGYAIEGIPLSLSSERRPRWHGAGWRMPRS